MKFCDVCRNMLYVEENTDHALVYTCKNCSFRVTPSKEAGSVCIVEDHKVNDALKYSQYINPYLKHDPTLPRVDNIPCPNAECMGVKDSKKNEIIFINYDPKEMRFLYVCCHCNYAWVNT